MRPLIARTVTVAVTLLAAACATPPPEAYVGGRSSGGTAIGRNAAGESCVQQARGTAGGLDVFCGSWQQPSATVVRLGRGGPGDLARVAADSAWRAGLETRLACAAPQPTTVLEQPALLLSCTRRIGGWPQVAVLATIDGSLYGADAIEPAVPVIPRAVGILSGRVTADRAEALPKSGAEALLASRLAAQSFKAGDVGQFDDLIVAGTKANLAESFVAAEDAYRAALALQRKALGNANPNEANTLALIALQLSDQGRYADADTLFSQAGQLAPRASDPATVPRLLHYRALNELNQHHDDAALALLRDAEARYAALLPPEAVRPRLRAGSPFVLGRSGSPTVNNPIPNDDVVVNQAEQSALLGVLETRRYQAIALRDLGRLQDSEATLRRAADLALSQGIRQPVLTARLLRTAAVSAAARGDEDDATSGLGLSVRAFNLALPGTRPIASTELLRAQRLHQAGRDAAALESCRHAAAQLRELKLGAPREQIEPCLDAAAATQPTATQPLLAEMFEMAQLSQGGITSQQIARSTARLRENARDPRVGEAIRRRERAGDTLADLTRRRDEADLRARGQYVGTTASPDPAPADLDAAIADARTQLADADAALQAASPNFGQLVQEVAPARDVLAGLRPGEALVSIELGAKRGWVFALRDGSILARPLGASPDEIRALVERFRKSVELGAGGLPAFDADAAQRLYQATLGPVAPSLAGATSIVVVPDGPLLSIPFAALLTGPAGPDLARAPFLIRQAAISHTPSPANFVSLRRIADTSRAPRPWFGLGEFRPITLPQAERAFPGPACQQSARLFATLPALPFAGRELEAARLLFGAGTADELTGPAYTVSSVQAAPLKQYRILHFASHALLPAELQCAQEPSIVTSAPAGAASGSSALLTASLISAMDLDANAVILSACNSAGPNGPAGESLSGLARVFFFAGARALLVTHWSVNDQTSAFLVADTLRRYKEGQAGGFAGSLRGAELALLDGAGKNLPPQIAHPFYWAPFALIGEDGAPARAANLVRGRPSLL